MTPSVSVIIPFLNAGRHLRAAVDSVRRQTLADWELLLVDDGSTDAGAAIAERAAVVDPGRVRRLRQPRGEPRGAFAARLLGARKARAPVLALLDADDLWEPDYLRRHLRVWRRAARAGAALCYGPARYWFPGGGAKDFVHPLPAKTETVFGPGELLQNFLSSGYATMPRTSGSLIRRTAFLSLARLEPAARAAPYYEDQFLMWGLAMRWPVVVHPGAWVRYRQRWPLAARPKSYLRATLRDEARFLPVIAAELAERHPGHVLLRPEGLPARLAALRRSRRLSAYDDFFFKRIPEDLAIRA